MSKKKMGEVAPQRSLAVRRKKWAFFPAAVGREQLNSFGDGPRKGGWKGPEV